MPTIKAGTTHSDLKLKFSKLGLGLNANTGSAGALNSDNEGTLLNTLITLPYYLYSDLTKNGLKSNLAIFLLLTFTMCWNIWRWKIKEKKHAEEKEKRDDYFKPSVVERAKWGGGEKVELEDDEIVDKLKTK